MRKDRLVSEVLGEESVLAPSDLYNKEFRRVVFGGYDPAEVDAFLERVADALEPLIRQVRDLKQQQEEHRATIDEYRQMEATLRSALVTSQKFGENLVESARREAEHLVAAARIEKDRLELDAAKLPDELAKEVRRLQEQRDRLRADILAILEAHRALLDAHVDAAGEAADSVNGKPRSGVLDSTGVSPVSTIGEPSGETPRSLLRDTLERNTE